MKVRRTIALKNVKNISRRAHLVGEIKRDGVLFTRIRSV